MKRKKLASYLHVTDKDLLEIKEEVIIQEKLSSGEIALAAVKESSDYSFNELFASMVVGVLGFAVLLLFNDKIENFLFSFLWQPASWVLPAFYVIACLLLIALSFIFSNTIYIDRLIIPRALQEQEVYKRALRHFVESGVYATTNRTGILIFISYLEREVCIIADTAIHKKIDPDEWAKIAQYIGKGIANKKTTEVLIKAIRECGSLLAKYFPPTQERLNELSDGLFFPEEE